MTPRLLALSLALALTAGGSIYLATDLQAGEWDNLYEAATQGQPEAQRQLGEAYLKGKGRGRDEAYGLLWLQRAASNNDMRAHYTLAQWYSAKSANPIEDQRVRHHLQAAASLGHPSAQTTIGQQLLDETLEPDLTSEQRSQKRQLALRLLLRAASGKTIHSAQANHLLASLFEEGLHVPANPGKAMQFLRRAAALGDPAANYRLAHVHLDDAEASHYSPTLGIKYLKRAGDHGHAEAAIELARRLRDGDQVDADLKLAKFAQRPKK